DFGQRRTMLKPKSYRLAGISYDEYCRGDQQSVSAVSVYATYATYHVARFPAKGGSPAIATAFPAFLPTACRCQTGMSDPGRGYPPVYTYCIYTVTQKEGKIRAFSQHLGTNCAPNF
ncbi:MAG: hypothetical protein OXE52_19595, partial [Chloroflexi bacterium]|nr:hypothetical protein [Chloroflexota bacterium]